MRLVSRTLDVKAPKGTLVNNCSYYTHVNGKQLKSRIALSSRSDTTDASYVRFSDDNSKSWTRLVPEPGRQRTNSGVLRRGALPGVVDPRNDELLNIVLQGVLPSDNPLEGQMHWSLRYTISTDGGRTVALEEPVIQRGAEFSIEHPLASVWLGKNAAMIGDKTCVPIWRKDGTLLVPIQISPLDNAGRLYNPGGGYTYHYAAVLLGTRLDNRRYEWELSQPVSLNPALSTRGCLEPTLAELSDNRILMIMRGSNDKRQELPGHKWRSISYDGGMTWSIPEPWGYSDGTLFYSPSSCSQLLPHTNGRLYWIGNITDSNPQGNLPRFPLVTAEVDLGTLSIDKRSICVLDDRQPGESSKMTLSNFYARQDRDTGEIVVHCPRFRAQGTWDGDAYLYKMSVE